MGIISCSYSEIFAVFSRIVILSCFLLEILRNVAFYCVKYFR